MAKQTRTMTTEDILAMRRHGASYTTIAKAADISPQRVGAICRRGSAKAGRGKVRVARVVAR